MKFIVEFKGSGYSPDGKFYLTNWNQTEVGLEALDALRQHKNDRTIQASEVVSSIPRLSYDDLSVLELTEEEARETGHFEDKNRLTVKCPGNANETVLNQYLRYVFHDEYRVARDIDTEAVFQAWKAAGYPLQWESESADDA